MRLRGRHALVSHGGPRDEDGSGRGEHDEEDGTDGSEAAANRKNQEEAMEDLVEKMVDKKKEKENRDVTTLKAFSDLPKLDGKPETFDNWHFKMFQFLTKDKNYIDIVKWIEEEGHHARCG